MDDKLYRLLVEFDQYLEQAKKDDIAESDVFDICLHSFDLGKNMVFVVDEEMLQGILLMFADMSGRTSEIKRIMKAVRTAVEALHEVLDTGRVSKTLLVALTIDAADTVADAMLASIAIGAAGGQSKALEVGEQLKSLLDEQEGGDA